MGFIDAIALNFFDGIRLHCSIGFAEIKFLK